MACFNVVFLLNVDSRLELRCKVEGNPFPKVVWRKGKWLQIDDGGRYDVTKNHETGLCIMAIKV